jgi:hypothetical protein
MLMMDLSYVPVRKSSQNPVIIVATPNERLCTTMKFSPPSMKVEVVLIIEY